jgi:chromosome partitioning protein
MVIQLGKIITIANEKGGIGKTISTMNISSGLQRSGKKVLLIDLDPQSSLTICFGLEPEDLDLTISNLMVNKINDEDYQPDIKEYIQEKEGLYLIPSDIQLSGIETSLINALSRETILKQIIDEIKSEFEYIIIDTPPSLGLLTINALAAADSVIIPVQAQYLSLKGMELLLNTIIRINKRINRNLQIEGIITTMYNQRTNMSRDISRMLQVNYGGHIRIFKNAIPYSTRAAEMTAAGQSIFEYDPRCSVAEAYTGVVKELLENEN